MGLEKDYAVLKEKVQKHPKDQKLRAKFEATKADLLKIYYSEADSINGYNLPQRRLIAQKISIIDSNYSTTLERITEEIEAINNKANDTSNETDVFIFARKYLNLIPYEPYLDSVKQLKQRFIISKPVFIEKIQYLQQNGKDDQAILLAGILLRIFPEPLAFKAIQDELLLNKSELPLSISRQYYSVELKDRLATSVVYAFLAWNYGKHDANLKSFINQGLKEVHALGYPKLALIFSPDFSAKQKNSLVSAISNSELFGDNVLVHELIAGAEPQPGEILIELDLTDLSIDMVPSRSNPFSKYLAGYQEVRNPEYAKLELEYQRALARYQEAAKQPDYDPLTGRLNGAKIAAATALSTIEGRLRRTAPLIKQEILQDYQYERTNVSYRLNMGLKYKCTDTSSGMVLKEETYVNKADQQRQAISGAHPQDVNKIKDVSISQEEASRILADFAQKNYSILTNRFSDLPEMQALYEANSAVEQGDFGRAVDRFFFYRLYGLLLPKGHDFGIYGEKDLDELCCQLGIVRMDDILLASSVSNQDSTDLSLRRIFSDSFIYANSMKNDLSSLKKAFEGFIPDRFSYVKGPTLTKKITKPSSFRRPTETPITGGISSARGNIIEDCLSSVVIIKTSKGTGSGFILNTRGYIVTNYHVVAGEEEVKVILNDGRQSFADIIALVKYKDLALLKINIQDVRAIKLGNLQQMKSGDSVYALGAPGGVRNQVLDQTVTKGIISAIRLLEAPYNPLEKIQFIQTDAAINPGNSGGPLINEKGEVIGVNSQKIVQEAVEGLNFAISIEEVKKSFAEYLK